MFNFGDIMGGGMSKAASLRKPQPMGGTDMGPSGRSMSGMAGNIASGMSSMFPRPDMGGQTYSPPSMQQPGMASQQNPMINFRSPMEGGPNSMGQQSPIGGGGFMERFRQMVPTGGVTGGMDYMNNPAIQDYRQKLMQSAGQQPMGGGFKFPMMGF